MKDGLKSELCGGRLAFWNYTTIEGNISPTASIRASIISVANQFINNNSGKNNSSLPLFGETFGEYLILTAYNAFEKAPIFCVLFSRGQDAYPFIISLSLVQCIQNKQLYFADRLYDSMKVRKTAHSTHYLLTIVSSNFYSLRGFVHMMCNCRVDTQWWLCIVHKHSLIA